MRSIVLIVGSTELCTLKNVLKISYIYSVHVCIYVCIYDACMMYVCMYVCIYYGSAGKESACNVGDTGSVPELGRSPGKGHSYPLQ